MSDIRLVLKRVLFEEMFRPTLVEERSYVTEIQDEM